MAHYRTTVTSAASADDVFTYLADFATVAEWDPGVREARLVSGDAAEVGAFYRVVTSTLGLTLALDYRILESVPPVAGRPGRVVLQADTRDFRSFDVILVEPTATGCALTYDADLALKGVRRPFDPFLRVAFQVIGGRARAGLESAVQMRQPA